ncbi:hypothetical protein PABG_05687 [Paracoccidioides brasiliensis Pb03]|nr:hypothetical protein PABG_05687 [Paracoccidioides brasiliensis Pb03]
MTPASVAGRHRQSEAAPASSQEHVGGDELEISNMNHAAEPSKQEDRSPAPGWLGECNEARLRVGPIQRRPVVAWNTFELTTAVVKSDQRELPIRWVSSGRTAAANFCTQLVVCASTRWKIQK